METFALVLDLFVVSLLVPTIIFAVILNNRLSVLRKNKEELARLIAAFNEATVRAESGIPKLRKASEEAGGAIQEKMERAQMLRDDLAFMVERAETMAGRLEGAIRQGRSEAHAMPVAAQSPGGAKDVESMAEARERAAATAKELTSGLAAAERAAERMAAPAREMRAEAERRGQERIEQARTVLGVEKELPSASAPRPRRGGQSLASALGGGEAAPRGGRSDDERSEAERELLRALQSAR